MRIVLMTAACVLVPTLGFAEQATVPSGQKSQVAIHSRFDNNCRPSRVVIKVIDAPKNGAVTSEPADYLVPAQNRAGVKQPPQCVGKKLQGVAVFYQSKPGFKGSDNFRYSRTNADRADDRFNAD